MVIEVRNSAVSRAMKLSQMSTTVRTTVWGGRSDKFNVITFNLFLDSGKKAEGVELQRVDSEEKSEELSSEIQEGASAAATVEAEAETPKEEEIQESREEVTDSWDAGGTEDEEEPSKTLRHLDCY